MRSLSTMMKGAALAALSLAALLAQAAEAPAPGAVGPELVAAAAREGKVVFYTVLDLQVATKLAKAFELRYPGVAVQVERSGAERIYQRVAQEYASGIHAVDAIESTNSSHLLDWKRRGWLAAYVPEDVASWPAAERDADGYYAAARADLLVMGYNTTLVAPEKAPKAYADLLAPEWQGKIVKAHPAYAGSIMTGTFLLSRLLGWDYFEKLGRQRVMQVQSSTEPPKKLAAGERAVMFDGQEYVALLQQKGGAPIRIVYPAEGTPIVPGSAALMRDAPHPSAARLFLAYLFSREGQQLLVDEGDTRSFHPGVKEPAGRPPLAGLKLLTADPVALEASIEEVKERYAQYFGN